MTISLPAVSDSGYYECEAALRSSSVPPVNAGAYLHVLDHPQFVKVSLSNTQLQEMEKQVVESPNQT
ncbi:hypothetical protein J4Q44_G00180960 [Coregonus suidteri]|uniref:Uncharacterized protein n=1 Tax=Coregonus suidteri TaxID=861788 RepID=A0AAN8LQ33_9TELE